MFPFAAGFWQNRWNGRAASMTMDMLRSSGETVLHLRPRRGGDGSITLSDSHLC